MTPQSSVDAEQEIIAEMQYLLGVTEDSADSAPALPNPPSKELVSK